VEVVVSEPADGKGRGVGASNKDCSGFAPVGYVRAVPVSYCVFERGYPIGCGVAGLVTVDFDGDGDAMQLTGGFPGYQLTIRGVRCGQCFLRRDLCQCIDSRVD
jgi:hypothetical protein